MQRERAIAARESSRIGLFYGAYHRVYLERRAQIEQQLATVRFLIEQAREELAEAFRVLKTYEITQDNENRRLRQEAERKETAILDEIGLTHHLRKYRGKRHVICACVIGNDFCRWFSYIPPAMDRPPLFLFHHGKEDTPEAFPHDLLANRESGGCGRGLPPSRSALTKAAAAIARSIKRQNVT